MDRELAHRIASSLTGYGGYSNVLEIGPGTGVLTHYLVESEYQVTAVEIDSESISYLRNQEYSSDLEILNADFLKHDLSFFQNTKWAVIGNFPYNISSQLFFRILDHKESVSEVVCMIQKEVAQRIASPPGNKRYGILSVFLQAYYEIEYLETVPPSVFNPPPKVDSGVIRLKRNGVNRLECDEELFRRIVKQGFQNRRKTLRNALKPLNLDEFFAGSPLLTKRAEQLSVNDFVELTNRVQQ